MLLISAQHTCIHACHALHGMRMPAALAGLARKPHLVQGVLGLIPGVLAAAGEVVLKPAAAGPGSEST